MSIQRNTTYNLLGAIVPLAISIVTIPLYLTTIGESRFGVLTIIWVLLGYFGIFDLGLGRATAQRIAALELSDRSKRAKVFWTAIALNVVLAFLACLVIWPFAIYFFQSVLKVEASIRPEMLSAVPWLILAAPIAIISGVLTGTLQGYGKFLELNVISIAGTTLFQVLPLFVALFVSVDLATILPAALLARLITLLVLFQRCVRRVGLDGGAYVEISEAKTLLKYGSWVATTSLVSPLLVLLDRLLIGAIVGAKEVTYYSIPLQLGERSTLVSNSLSAALFPRFAAASLAEARKLAVNGTKFLVLITSPLVLIGIMLINPFLAWWISPQFAENATYIGEIIIFGFWVSGIARIPYALLQAQGQPDIVAKCHLAEILPYLALLSFGLITHGILGAAFAFSTRLILDYILLSKFANLLENSLKIMIFPSILLVFASVTAVNYKFGSEVWLVASVSLVFLVCLWFIYSLPISLRRIREIILVKVKDL